MDSSAPVQRPPLPQEILQMAEDETACKFCGVSYLILSRTEKLEKLVESLNQELDLRKKYIEERPALLLKIQRSENDIVTMTQELQESNKKADLYERQWKEISSANERLSKDLEATNSKVQYLQYKQKEKLSKLNESLTQMAQGLKIEKTRLSRMKDDVRECFSTVPTAMNDTVRRITQQLQIYYDNQQISIKNDYERQLSEYRDREIQSSEELKNREQKIEKLEMTRQESDVKMEQMKSDISELKSAIESQLQQIKDLTRSSDDLQSKFVSTTASYESQISSFSQEKTILLKRSQQKEQVLQEEIVLLTQNIKKLEEQLKEQKKLNESDVETLMVEKKGEIDVLQKSIERLQHEVAEMSVERSNMLKLHEKELESTKEEFQKSCQEQIQNAENSIKIEFEKEKLKIEEEWAMKLEKALSLEQTHLSELSRLKEQCESSEKEIQLWAQKTQELEEELKNERNRANELESQIQATTDSQSVKLTSLQNHLELEKSTRAKLEQQLKQLETELQSSSNLPPSSLIKERENDFCNAIESLKSQLTSSHSEIQFLKETVKFECEERIKLLSEIDELRRLVKVKNNGSMPLNKDAGTRTGAGEKDLTASGSTIRVSGAGGMVSEADDGDGRWKIRDKKVRKTMTGSTGSIGRRR